MGVDCDRPCSSCSLSSESCLLYAGASETCGANIEGGADGEGGLTEGFSNFTGDCAWLSGEVDIGRATVAVAIFLEGPLLSNAAVSSGTRFGVCQCLRVETK